MEDTIAVLRGLKEKYAVQHGVEITDPAVVAVATLSHRYAHSGTAFRDRQQTARREQQEVPILIRCVLIRR